MKNYLESKKQIAEENILYSYKNLKQAKIKHAYVAKLDYKQGNDNTKLCVIVYPWEEKKVWRRDKWKSSKVVVMLSLSN